MLNDRNNRLLWWAAAVLFSLVSCTASGSRSEDEYLIRIGDNTVTVADFNRAFEIAKTAYPHGGMQSPADLREARVRLLNQMTEELILWQRAAELNIDVSEEEVEQEVARVKADYPDDVFEQTLLEYAVSYKAWKNGLKTRLLMEKLVDRELKDEIVITPDEIAKFYKENYSNETARPGDAERPEDVDEIIVKQLRREKMEKAYRSWTEALHKRYTIDINSKRWEEILTAQE